METGAFELAGTEAKYSLLRDAQGNWLHVYYAVIPERPEQIVGQIGTIERAEAELFKALELDPETAAAKRFFSSYRSPKPWRNPITNCSPTRMNTK